MTPFAGYGLTVLEPVSRGRPIVEYCGEVITVATCRERLSELKPGEDFYFASLDADHVLDAAPMGSNARFANHSCNPNCQLQKWVVGGVPRVVLCADQDLPAGTQVRLRPSALSTETISAWSSFWYLLVLSSVHFFSSV